VLDRNRYAAMMTSFANGGQLSASNAEVWTQFSTVLKGIRWMFKRDAPLLINPRPDWHKYSWMAEFVGNIPNYESNTIESTRLAIAARHHLFDWASRENIDFDHEARGIMHICVDKHGFEHGQRVNELLARGGLERHSVTPDEMRAIEPALSGDLYGGFYTESDSTGDIHKYTRGLAQACQRKGGKFLFDVRVQKLSSENGKVQITYYADEDYTVECDTFDGVVICAGIESRRFARQLGDRVNIYPVKGYSITIDLPNAESREAAPWTSLLDDKAKVVSSRLGDNRLRIAGTAEFNGVNYDIRDNRIRPLVSWCRRFFPAVDTEHVVPWAGLRPMMPSMMPKVGAGRQPGVFYNTGHGHLGWTLCAATSEIVGDVIEKSLPSASG
ncbi:MAG: D-amino acid dehydrogenase, partial [Granulosicoccus sp.]|nr:D-amino acid dehydrogenase [Granulosicoccus sp.]